MNTKNEDFFSKLSKFFDIFLVSVFNWELFWFSSNSLKKYANLAKFSLKRSDLIDFWRQNDNSGNDVLSWLQTQKSLVWTFIWILDFMSVNLDLLPWVFIFGPLLIGWTFGPLLTDLDLWMCHFGPEYLDLFRPLLFIMKGEFSCWKNRNELKKNEDFTKQCKVHQSQWWQSWCQWQRTKWKTTDINSMHSSYNLLFKLDHHSLHRSQSSKWHTVVRYQFWFNVF